MTRFCSIFTQLLQLFPRTEFQRAVCDTKAERHARGFDCWSQFIAMLFCQLGKAQSLREIGFNSATELFATYAGQPGDLAPWLADVQINYDRNLRLQYLAGMGLNLYQSGPIYADMISYATKFPENLFTGTPEKLQELRQAFERVRNIR